MKANEREKIIYGKTVEVVQREDDFTVYRLSNNGGEVVMTSYDIFPGIELIYNDVHIQSCKIERGETQNILEINHCREGRIECGFKNEYIYLAPGDLTIARKNDVAYESYFPLSHYHGITIAIDLDRVPACLDCFLIGVDVKPSQLLQKFCSDDICYITRSNPSVAHIFSELYTVPQEIRKGYFKVKVLELLLFLSGMDAVNENYTRRRYLSSQVKLAKAVCQYLTAHMGDRITLAELTERFNASGTLIKNSFKGVYGVSIYVYIRRQKMQEAAHMLLNTDRTVLEIAGCFGYANASKFAAAFREVMEMSPMDYRAMHRGAK